jgi:hypothetical protein
VVLGVIASSIININFSLICIQDNSFICSISLALILGYEVFKKVDITTLLVGNTVNVPKLSVLG